jgi:hypothetical protein
MSQKRKNTRKDMGESPLWEVTPGTICVPMLPRLKRDALEPGPISDAQPQEWFSKPTTLDQADAHRREAVESCVARYKARDPSGIRELLEVAREFCWDPRFAEVVADLYVTERIEKRAIGRPIGHSRPVHQRILRIGRVVEGLRDSGLTLEEIFDAMDRQRFETVSDRRRRRDHNEARRHPALESQLFTRDDQRRILRGGRHDGSGFVFEVTRIRVEPAFTVPTGLRLHATWTRSAQGVTIHLTVQ